MILYILPIIFLGITIFIMTQLCDRDSDRFCIPMWFIFLLILYFVPVVNIVAFSSVIFLLIMSNAEIRKNSLLEKIVKLLNKEIWI